MSVIVRGMEMPTSCRACHLKMNCDDCEGWECVCKPLEMQIGYWDDLLADKRRDDCPLVPVPPHGRLIDADALKEMAIPKNPEAQFHAVSVSDIERAPTVIPAEEGGDT